MTCTRHFDIICCPGRSTILFRPHNQKKVFDSRGGHQHLLFIVLDLKFSNTIPLALRAIKLPPS